MPASAADAGEPLMTPAELAAWLGGDITEDTLQLWRTRGGGPEFVKAGRFVRYRPEDVTEWLKRRKAGQVAS
jgi:DNA-binding transcriptional MerR regulator